MAWLQWLGPLLQGAGQLKAGTENAAILRAQAEAAEEQGRQACLDKLSECEPLFNDALRLAPAN